MYKLIAERVPLCRISQLLPSSRTKQEGRFGAQDHILTNFMSASASIIYLSQGDINSSAMYEAILKQYKYLSLYLGLLSGLHRLRDFDGNQCLRIIDS